MISKYFQDVKFTIVTNDSSLSHKHCSVKPQGGRVCRVSVMSLPSASGSITGPHIVVVGNYKGGTGKTTVAMHMVVALQKAGQRVACYDLDMKQQSLARYIENRREWTRRNGLPLELPRVISIPEVAPRARPGNASQAALFVRSLAELRDDCDFIVIDTPGNEDPVNLIAHRMADTLVTPINDSFVDLDTIVTIAPSTGLEIGLYSYA